MRGNGADDRLELRDVALQRLELVLAALQHPADQRGDELLGQLESPSNSRNATSGSTIQNSIRWRRVFDFSARKVGPKQ